MWLRCNAVTLFLNHCPPPGHMYKTGATSCQHGQPRDKWRHMNAHVLLVMIVGVRVIHFFFWRYLHIRSTQKGDFFNNEINPTPSLGLPLVVVLHDSAIFYHFLADATALHPLCHSQSSGIDTLYGEQQPCCGRTIKRYRMLFLLTFLLFSRTSSSPFASKHHSLTPVDLSML